MVKKILILCPSRKRNQKHIETYEHWKNNTNGDSDLLFGLDSDDESNYTRQDCLYEVIPKLDGVGINRIINFLATKYADKYDYIGFIGDDHRFRTKDFEKQVLETGKKIVYGNDLLQGKNLPTACFISSDIIKKLGYISPPTLQHLYIDNFWLELGTGIDSIAYIDEMIIEHCHFSNGKSSVDALYEELNASSMYEKDRTAYEEYKKNQFQNDLEKLYGI